MVSISLRKIPGVLTACETAGNQWQLSIALLKAAPMDVISVDA